MTLDRLLLGESLQSIQSKESRVDYVWHYVTESFSSHKIGNMRMNVWCSKNIGQGAEQISKSISVNKPPYCDLLKPSLLNGDWSQLERREGKGGRGT